jgi:two-component system alkaline phosphatase synthesis response regulator PhoP
MYQPNFCLIRNSMPRGQSILLIEDEEDIRKLVTFNLQKDGFVVEAADSAEKAFEILTKINPALIILDLMLPEMDGFEFIKELHRIHKSAIPVIIVSAKSDDTDIVAGLEIGADDFICKPFNPKVLIARIRSILRRNTNAKGSKQKLSSQNKKAAEHKDLITIDSENYEARIAGQKLILTSTEFKILTLLTNKKGRIFSRYQIVDSIHGTQHAVTDRSIDAQIKMLRKKLGTHAELIETIRGIGYRLREAV